MKKNSIVRKKNSLIMDSSYNLSLEEQRIIITLCSMVKSSDEDFKEYKFKVKEFLKIIGVKDQSKYTELPKITKGLMSKPFEIREGNKIIQLNWLCESVYLTNQGTVSLMFSPSLKPYLLRLGKLYTSYKLENILELRSKYSIRIYEILKCNQFKNQELILEVDELKTMLGIGSKEYPNYGNLKQKVLNVTKKEIGEKTDIKFDFREIKTGRKITSVAFSMNKIKPIKKGNFEVELCDFNNTNQIKELLGGKVSEEDVKKLLLVSENDVDRVVNAYKLSLEVKNISNFMGWMIKAIKNNYKKGVKVENKSKTNTNFNNSSLDMVKLGKMENIRLRYKRGDITAMEYKKSINELI